MTSHHGPTPAPANIAELVDGELVAAGLADYLEQVDPPLFDELMDGQLSWTLEGCDALGVATVDVVAKATGERVATAKVHWTQICRPS
jgi:hypothetical protein